jgi:thiosulfate dehydrogenase [quinone] large subunit
MTASSLSGAQGATLVALRTVIGWHFLYEGFVKLWLPGWSRDGTPLATWSSAGYLRTANGPFADLLHGLANASWLPTIDLLVAIGLVLVGLSLTLGVLTQAGCVGALALLAMFYLSNVPTRGVHRPGAEGAYLFVDKNLVEAVAVAVVLAFRTGGIAGLDLLWQRRLAIPAAEEHP